MCFFRLPMLWSDVESNAWHLRHLNFKETFIGFLWFGLRFAPTILKKLSSSRYEYLDLLGTRRSNSSASSSGSGEWSVWSVWSVSLLPTRPRPKPDVVAVGAAGALPLVSPFPSSVELERLCWLP